MEWRQKTVAGLFRRAERAGIAPRGFRGARAGCSGNGSRSGEREAARHEKRQVEATRAEIERGGQPGEGG